MKKGQVIFDFLILGTIMFVLTFMVACKYQEIRIAKYANLENDLNRATIVRKSHEIPAAIHYRKKNKILVNTEYFSYYVPSCLSNKPVNCEKYKTQKELRNAISQIVKELEAQGIEYNLNYYNNLINSINYYINAGTKDVIAAEYIMNKAYDEYKNDLLKSKSPIAKQNAVIIDRIISQIKSIRAYPDN